MNQPLVDFILVFLGVALLLYVLLAGADFGAGILELFLGRAARDEQKTAIAHAIAPVWEANHVWLILVVVILFMGFPQVYTLISTYLHLPLLAVLAGVTARGCAFTFRYYDTGPEYHRLYSWIFALSSVWTSFFLGVLAGSIMLGRISPDALDFASAYVHPWANTFCAALGIFTCTLFAFLAAVYMVGEAAEGAVRDAFRKKASYSGVGVIAAGALVFAAAHLEGYSLLYSFFTRSESIFCFVAATVLWLPFWLALQRPRHTVITRALGAVIVALVLFGWFAVRFPAALNLRIGGKAVELDFYSLAAPEATLRALLGALIVGSFVIFPALAYLLRVFKWETLERE